MVDDFKKNLPLFTEAANPAMQAHHWQQVFASINIEHDMEQPFTVLQLAQWGMLDNMEALSNVLTQMKLDWDDKEFHCIPFKDTCTAVVLTQMKLDWDDKEFHCIPYKDTGTAVVLTQMKLDWDDKEFHCIPYKDTGTAVVGQTDEIQMMLDDQCMKILAMNSSPYVKPFREEATKWEQTLSYLQELIDQWIACQSTWMYLEPIFSSADIVKQMPEEGSKFSRVDTAFRALMEECMESPSCLTLAQDTDRLDSLKESNKLLDEVQKGLAAYLEKKRLFFPRFFFLSNDEMLEILSETKDPTRVQPHLRKCFEGIHRLEFHNLIVQGMTSVEKEVVPFKTVVNTAQAKGSVEVWLLEVEDRMFEAVHNVTGKGVEAYPTKTRSEWVLEWPGMVVLVASNVFWTRGVEKALSGGTLTACEKQCEGDLMNVVDQVRGDLTTLQRATLGALVVMDVHARDVVANMVKEKVTEATDFRRLTG
eukprot:gene24707-10345_t